VNFVVRFAPGLMDWYHSFVTDRNEPPSAQCETFLLIQNKSWFSFEHCAGLQGSNSARRKFREEGFEGWQKFILQSTQANKKLGSNRIDTVETVDNVLWLGNIFLHPGASHRRRRCGVHHAISTTGTHLVSLSIHSFGCETFVIFCAKYQCGVNKVLDLLLSMGIIMLFFFSRVYCGPNLKVSNIYFNF
jgi:hypothetical protein